MAFQTNKNHPDNRGDLDISKLLPGLCSIWLELRDSNYADEPLLDSCPLDEKTMKIAENWYAFISADDLDSIEDVSKDISNIKALLRGNTLEHDALD